MSALPDFEKLIQSMVKAIERKPVIPLEHQLWSEEQVAQYFGYEVLYCRRNIMVHPNFPPSRDLPTSPDGERIAKMYAAKDIVKYAMAIDKRAVSYK
jgi:hypothetical protein